MLGSMLKRFRNPPAPTLAHPVLGELRYCPRGLTWSSHGATAVEVIGLPGDETGPSVAAVETVLARLEAADHYRDLCADDLMHVARSLASLPYDADVRTSWQLAAIRLDLDEWELCFHTRPPLRHVEMAIQFAGEAPVSNTIST